MVSCNTSLSIIDFFQLRKAYTTLKHEINREINTKNKTNTLCFYIRVY